MLIGSITALSLVIAVAVGICSGVSAALLWILPLTFAGCYLGLLLLTVGILWLICNRIDVENTPTEDSPFYRKLIYLVADAICTVLRMRIHTEGLEKTPSDGRFLLVCNHLFDLDPVVLYACFKKSQLAFISKRENTDYFLVGKVMHKLNCQLINRENDREALKTILNCIQLIKNDENSIAVFPEGYTSTTGRLQHFRPGVFKIAMKSNVPVVVCTLRNTNHVLHNFFRLKPTDIHLHLVEVIPAEELKGKTAVDISNRAFADMLNDLGPEFTPVEDIAE